MNRHFKKIAFIIITLGAIFIIATVSINIILKNKLEVFINNRLPENMVRSYDALTMASFEGSLNITNASLIIKNKGNGIKHTFINVENLKITDISYWDYLINGEINIESISIDKPTMAYYKDRIKPNKDSIRKGIFEIYKPINIDKVIINNTKFAIYEEGKDSTKLYTKGLSIEVDGIKMDAKTHLNKIPFEYSNVKAKSDTVFVKVSPFENLTVRDFSIENNTADFDNLELKTKYSKKELSKVIAIEQDYYNLTLKSLSVEDFDFGFNHNRFFAKSKKISLATPSLEVYRDKLVADNNKPKSLYSKMLRNLPFDLTVDSLKIFDAKIKYEERVKKENMGGTLNFEKLEAAISNVSNTYKEPIKTTIKVNADFMEHTPIAIDWEFDVQNKNDQFLFKANIGPLVAEKMNSFTEPNLKVKLEGNTTKTYFTIDGNNDTSTIDMKINYSDFEVSILRKNGKGKNKFLSAIANIFLSKNSDAKNTNYREGIATATRDKTKSVFNFLWINLKNALIKTMLGGNKNDTH